MSKSTYRRKYKPTKSSITTGSVIQFTVLFCTIVALIMILTVPIKYSTIANNKIIKKLVSVIEGGYGGIVASNIPIDIEGYDFDLKASQYYIMDSGDKDVATLKRCAELNLLQTNINIEDLCTIFYAYYADEYNANLSLYKQIGAWYSELEANDNGTYILKCNNTKCKFVREISSILDLDAETITNSNAHCTYHNQVEKSLEDLELSDNELQQVYEAYILTNHEYIREMSLDFTIIHQDLLMKKEKLSNWILNTDSRLVRFLFGDVKYSVNVSKENLAEVLNYIDFAKDEEIITDEILPLVPLAVQSYGVSPMGLHTDSTTVINISDIDNVEEWLKGNHDKHVYKSVTTDEQFIDCGFAKLFWDIKNISYIDNIPTLDELLSDSNWLKEQKIALIEQAVWQMFYTGGSSHTNE